MATRKNSDAAAPYGRRELLLRRGRSPGRVRRHRQVARRRPARRQCPAPAPAGPFSLPTLPYADNALDPVISANTLNFHHGKHHQAYVDNLNKAVAGTPFAAMALDKIIAACYGVADKSAVYNNAAQHWNHSFYWRSLKPQGGGDPPAALKQKIEASFGSVDACRKELLGAATTQFGSGWAWLVQDGTTLVGQQDRQRRFTAQQGPETAADHRRVGARVLSRLPEPPGRLRECGARQAPQLELCRPESRPA